MRITRVALVSAAVLVLAAAAFAEDVGERFERAVRQIENDDPDARQKGRLALEQIVEERPDLIRRIVSHPDPEVAATASRVLFDHPVTSDLVAEKRFGEILDGIADRARTWESRRQLFAKYVALSAEAVEFLGAEMRDAVAEPVNWSRTIKMDDLGVIQVRLRNCGKGALWFDPMNERDLLRQVNSESFGGSWSSRASQGFGCNEGDSRIKPPEARVLDALAGFRRVPPGSEFILATLLREPREISLTHFEFSISRAVGREAVISGVPLRLLPIPSSHPPLMNLAVLDRHDVKGMEAGITGPEPGGRPTLRVKPRPGNSREGEFRDSHSWWAAVGEHGEFLGSSEMQDPLKRIRQTPDAETVELEMPCDPPAGTKLLYMGLDLQGGVTVVPSPFEVRKEKPH